MSLVRWFRKNNTKVMAVVVIGLMIAFIGGSSLSYLLRGSNGQNKKVAYYGDNIGIKRSDLINAQQELDVLDALQAGAILKAIPDPIEQTPLLQSLILGELLFSDSRPSKEVVSYLQQASGKYMFRINKEQINNIYKLKAQSYYYWFLLDKEAQIGGYKIPNETSRNLLASALPQLMGVNYVPFMDSMINSTKLSENRILSIFSKLLAVVQYSHTICTGQNLTIKQLQSLASSQGQSVDIELVRVNAKDFISKLENPTDQQISEQFDKYKGYSLNEITSENPYGFGYKLPNRVQLEYMAVKLDDIKEIIKEPTFEELSDFYNTNKANAFTEQVQENPDDPNSGMISRTKPFSEVADDIEDYLTQEKITQKAEAILLDAKSLADGKLQDYNDAELDEFDIEQCKELAGDFTEIAEELREKYNVKIYQDITGELSAEEMQTEELLSKLYKDGFINTLSLAQVVFDIEQFGMNLLGSYEPIKPRIYMSIAPVKEQTGEIMAITRVVKAINASTPESVDFTYSKKPIIVDPNDENKEEYTVSIKEKVIEDIKCLEAMDTAKEKANEFIELASSQDDEVWDNVIEKFNELYEQEYPKDSNDTDLAKIEDSNEPTFKLENHYSLSKLLKETLLTITHNQSNPSVEGIKNLLSKESQFINMIYSLAPENNDSEMKPTVLEFKPDLSYYVIKNISMKHLWKEDYEKKKSILSYRKDSSESQSSTMEYFNPENIFKRMNFRHEDETEDSEKEEVPEKE